MNSRATVRSNPFPFWISTSLSSTAKSSLTFTQNRLTNSNTYYTLYATFYAPKVPFLSVYPSDCSESAQWTIHLRINEPMTYVHKGGYHRHFLQQEITRAKDITRKVPLLPKNATTTTTIDKSECIQFLFTYNRHPSATTHQSFANSSAFGPHPVVATTYSCLHLLLPSDAATTSASFLYEPNYATLHKTPYPRGSFQRGSHCSTCTDI